MILNFRFCAYLLLFFSWSIMDSPICSAIQITFDLDAVGLVGGEYESEPSVHTWCSFNPHRIIKSQKLDEIVPTKPGTQQAVCGVYSSKDKRHRFNRASDKWVFASQEGDDASSLFKIAANEEEEEEKLEFEVPQNMSVYRTPKPIAYDLSDKRFHGHKTMRTDASIWMKLTAVSLFSGVPKIDASDRLFTKVKRGVQVGVCQLQLCDLYKEAAASINHTQSKPGDVTFQLESNFVDPKLLNIEMAEIADRYIQKHGIRLEEISREVEQHIIETAFLQSRKAIITAQVTLRQFDFEAYRDSRFSLSDLKTSPLNAYMDMRATAMKARGVSSGRYGNDVNGSNSMPSTMMGRVSFDPIMYNSMPGMNEIRTSMDTVLRIYCDNLVPIEDRGCLYQPMNANVKKLHLPQFISEQGKTPVINFFSSHTPHTREYASEELRRIELELYDYNDRSEDLLELMLKSSLRRHGMSRELMMATVAEYFSKENKSNVASGLFITVLKVISDVGTFAANSGYYTADFRYQKLDKNATELIAHSRKRQAYYKKINLDSFDSVTLNGSINSQDCEDSANVACTLIQCMGHGRYTLGGRWKSDALNSVKSVLDRVVIFAVGSTVTSIFYDNSNKPIDMKEGGNDLPVVGDKVDTGAHCDGHCFAILIMDAIVDQLLANGNLSTSQLQSLRDQWRKDGIVFNKRDYTVPLIVLEGTGSVEPTVLPVDEVFGFEDREVERVQTSAEIRFLKEMKAKLNGNEKFKDLGEMFTGEGVEFYIAKQKANRRVSRFYREVIHGVPCNLYTKNEILSQVVFCKKVMTKRGETTYEYGVNTGELLRSGMTMTKEIALIAPFKDHAKVWREKIVPIMESVQNQMPIMQACHYTEEEYKEYIHSRFLANPNRLNDKNGSLIEAELERVAGNPDLMIIRLQSRLWKLNDKEKVARLNKFIMSFDRVVCHGMYSEKHLKVCDSIVEILLVVKTA